MKNDLLKICAAGILTLAACNSDRHSPDASDTIQLDSLDNNQLEDTMTMGTNQTDTMPPTAKSSSY